MTTEEICGQIKQKFFDMRKGYFNGRAYHDVSKGAVNVLKEHQSLFDILMPLSKQDLEWLMNTSAHVLVKKLSYLNPPNFLLVDIVTLQEQLLSQLNEGDQLDMNKIADATQWTFDSIGKTITAKPKQQKSKTNRTKKK